MASLSAFTPPGSTPTVAARLAASRAPLFPAGLVVDGTTTGEDRRAAPGWEVQYAQLGPGRCQGRHVSVHTASVQVSLEHWSVSTLKRGRPPRGSVTFVIPIGAGGAPRLQGRPVSAGRVVVLFEGDELDYRSAGPARLLSVSMERSALERHVRVQLDRHLGELRLRGRLGGLSADDPALERYVGELIRRAARHPGLLRDAAFARGVERRLVEMLFARLDSPSEPEAPRRGRALARKAEAWLRQNLTEPPTIAALCAGIHASERTLHEAFREHLGTTPKAYLKTLRLNAARADLLKGLANTRVTDVAMDWGFLHFGWFSQDYRRLFGETPSQTLHRGRAGAACRVDAAGPHGRAAERRPLAAVYAM